MVLYESHTGGLYATEEPQELEALYCEQCGDSDREIGTFETVEELWDFIKPSYFACIGCENTEECDSIDECDKVDANVMNYVLLNCMELLSEFAEDGKGETVSLICKNKTDGKIFVNFKPKGYKFGEKLALPSSFCLAPEMEEKVAYSLIPVQFEIVKKPEKKHASKDGKTVFWYCEVLPDPEDKHEEDSAWWYMDGWYGWTLEENIAP